MAVLMYPVATEKAVGMIEKGNVIEYIVDMRASKTEVRKEFERIFAVKIDRIGIVHTPDNRKKAIIKIGKEFKASDIALRLKLI